MKKQLYLVLVLLLIFAGHGCKQVQDIKAFTEANYRLEGVENVKLNGVDLDKRLQTEQGLSTSERDSLLTAVTTNRLQMGAILLLRVELPDANQDSKLTLTKLQWLLLIDGKEAMTGTVDETMVLEEGLNTLPIQTPVQLTEVDGQPNYEGLNRIINLVSRNANLKQHITFQIKPTVKTPVGNITAPNYITVSKPQNENV
ncbi:hypothetical protein [Pontibacter harenae]|uniref:hypothetical protein n=1 Tax=Pontibacter harenae TaxID=2894083 RepID=UPI001E370C97|nr:hypothetical protein [Pontibacter harenae]MCC9166806.1 hypothetical protein [Pontibacter harenae]